MEIVKGENKKEVLSEEELEAKEEEELKSKATKIARKYGIKSTKKLFMISVFDEDVDEEDEENEEGGKWRHGWLRKPSLSDFSMFTKLAETDKIDALKSILNTVWLQGDDKILQDDDCMMSAMLQIEPIMNVFASKIKKF